MVAWGIIGFGWVARDFVAPAIRDAGHRLAAVCDPDPGARAAAERLGARGYESPEALCADEAVEAVYVATPNHLHSAGVEAAARAGRAVLCEKPMAATLADAEAMVRAVEAAGILYGTAFDQRHHPVHRAIRAAIAEGAVGTVTAIRIVYACWLGPDWGAGDNWRIDGVKAGGGALMDLAPHGLDLATFLTGSPIEAVAALTQTRVQPYAVDDGAALVARHADGTLLTLHVAYNHPETLPRRRLEVVGDRGLIVAQNTMGQDPGGTAHLTDARTGETRALAVPGIERSPFLEQILAFGRALRSGDRAPFDAARDLHGMRCLAAAYGGGGPPPPPHAEVPTVGGPRSTHHAAAGEGKFLERTSRPAPRAPQDEGAARTQAPSPGAPPLPRRDHPMTKRPIQGLPADLPDAARAYLDALPPGRVVAFPMAPLDRTGVPAWKAALFLEDPRFPGAMPSGYGYGTTDGDAIVGALAEIAEMIGPTLAMVDRPKVLGSYDALARERGARGVADPLTLCLPAGSPVGRDTPLAWTEGFRVATGEPVLIPLDVAACDVFELPPGYKPFTTLITNGLGAGPDLDWAVAHGLLECLQRDGNGLLFRALDQGVTLDLPDDLEPATRELLARLDHLGIEVLPKFATDEFGLANLYVVGYDRASDQPHTPIMLSGCGEACDPDRERALRKALLEFCSARVRKAYGHGPLAGALKVAPPRYVEDFIAKALPSLEGEETRALTAMMDWARMDGPTLRRHLSDSVFSRNESKPFVDLPKTPIEDTRARGGFARERLEAAGIDVLAVDCSLPGVGVAKVVAPTLEVETMSYHRIGERNARKLLERDHPLIRFGDATDTLRPVRLSPEAIERLGGQPLFDTALADTIVGPLYPLYREPEAHHVAYRLGQVPSQRRSA